MLDRLIRTFVLGLVRLFYPRIEVLGQEHLPTSGPVVFVTNHSNGLLDPLLVTASAGRPVRFLAASYLFRYPIIGRCMQAFGALPVYRDRDGDREGKDLVEQNEEIFARCRRWLQSEGALALFPEGTTHSGSKLLRLRSGAARIAVGAEAEANWRLQLKIVPLGLWYEAKTLFRSKVLVVVGEPFGIEQFALEYATKPTRTLRAVTNEIARRLSAVVLQAENRELLDAIPVVAAWTSIGRPPRSLGERYTRAGELLEAYARLSRDDPGRLGVMAQQARRYARTLRLLGIADPWALELAPPSRRKLIFRGALLALTAPLALAGLIFSYGPYRAARPIAHRLARSDDTQIGHTKLMAGAVLVPLGWLIVAGGTSVHWGARRGLLLMLLQPALGYIALRWGEGWRELRDTLRYGWIRRRHRALAEQLAERRRRLALDVQRAAALPDAAACAEGAAPTVSAMPPA